MNQANGVDTSSWNTYQAASFLITLSSEDDCRCQRHCTTSSKSFMLWITAIDSISVIVT